MIYTIENEEMKVQVSSLGAEMTSIFNKNNSAEYLWPGTPPYWKNHAKVLFPVVGRLWDGKYNYKGNTYEMGIHGFASSSEFTMVEKKDDCITFCLEAGPELLKQYPFLFRFSVTYTLQENTVKCSYLIENNDEKDMFYSCGGHPGFNVPLAENEAFDDYYLDFGKADSLTQVLMSERCYCTGEKAKYTLEDIGRLNLRHCLFDNDAMFFTDIPSKIELRSKKSDRFVVLECPDMKYVGVWHTPKSDAPFVCIEPWSGIAANDGEVDDLETKNGISVLAPHTVGTYNYNITIG